MQHLLRVGPVAEADALSHVEDWGNLVDWDGDGDLDKLVPVPSADGSHATLRYFMGTPSGLEEQFGDENPFGTHIFPKATSIVAVDWDSDGDADLVVGTDDGTILFMERSRSGGMYFHDDSNTPFRNIAEGTSLVPYPVDWDGDGDLDLLCHLGTGEYILWQRIGVDQLVEMTSSFNIFNLMMWDTNIAPLVTDWDGDGDLDLIVGVVDRKLWYIERLGEVSFAPMVEWTASSGIAVGNDARPFAVDWNGDGHMDLLVGSRSTSTGIAFFLGNSTDGSLIPMSGNDNPFAALDYSSHSRPCVVDWNGDGHLDLLAGGQGVEPDFFLGSASGSLTKQTGVDNPFQGLPAGDFQILDLDQDGDLDVVVSDGFSGAPTDDATPGWARVYLQGDSGSLQESDALSEHFTALQLDEGVHFQIVDVDGDGDLDVVSGSDAYHGAIRVFLEKWCQVTNACSSKGSCDPLEGICECNEGFASQDCSTCLEGYHGLPPESLTFAGVCLPCPWSFADGRAGVCSLRGHCMDDVTAKEAAFNAGFSNTSILYTTGSGECNCSEHFSGNACQSGDCPAGQEPVGVPKTCQRCKPRFFKADPGNALCTPCSAKEQDSADGTYCECMIGFYLTTDANGTEMCQVCHDPDVVCLGGTNPPVSKNGYYMTSLDSAAKCVVYVPGSGSVCTGGCSYENRTESCVDGHTGLACGSCEVGYVRRQPLKECVACDDFGGSSYLALLIAWEFVYRAGFAIFLSRRVAASAVHGRTDAILFRIVSQWWYIQNLMLVIDITNLKPFSGEADPIGFPQWFVTTWDFVMDLTSGFVSKSEIYVQCLIKRHVPPERASLATVYKVSLFWWVCYPLSVNLAVLVIMMLVARVFWPLSVVIAPSIGRWALRRLLLSNGVSRHVADKQVVHATPRKIWRIFQLPGDLFGDPHRLHDEFGLEVLREVTQYRCTIVAPAEVRSDIFRTQSRRSGGTASMGVASITSQEQLMMHIVTDAMQRVSEMDIDKVIGVFKDPEGFMLDCTPDDKMDVFRSMTNSEQTVRNRASRTDLDVETPTYVVGLFTGLDWKSALLDTQPVYVLAIYTIWGRITDRFMQTFQYVRLPKEAADGSSFLFGGSSGYRWAGDTDIVFFGSDHLVMAAMAIAGILVWSIGTCIVIQTKMRQRHINDTLYTASGLRIYGYFFIGLEPTMYWWEVIAKRLDLFLALLFNYTGEADVRGKLVFNTAVSGAFMGLHLYHQPFDDRQARLLDRMETRGLLSRFLTWAFVSLICIQANYQGLSQACAILTVGVNALYLSMMTCVMCIELLSGMDERFDVRNAAEAEPFFKRSCMHHAVHFVGKERSWLERTVQHFVWCGPRNPIQIMRYSAEDKSIRKENVFRWAIHTWLRKLYELDDTRQTEHCANLARSIISHLLTVKHCQQISCHMLGFVFTLPIALRRLTQVSYGTNFCSHLLSRVEGQLHKLVLHHQGVPEQITKRDDWSQLVDTKRFEGTHDTYQELSTTAEELGQAVIYLYRLNARSVEQLLRVFPAAIKEAQRHEQHRAAQQLLRADSDDDDNVMLRGVTSSVRSVPPVPIGGQKSPNNLYRAEDKGAQSMDSLMFSLPKDEVTESPEQEVADASTRMPPQESSSATVAAGAHSDPSSPKARDAPRPQVANGPLQRPGSKFLKRTLTTLLTSVEGAHDPDLENIVPSEIHKVEAEYEVSIVKCREGLEEEKDELHHLEYLIAAMAAENESLKTSILSCRESSQEELDVARRVGGGAGETTPKGTRLSPRTVNFAATATDDTGDSVVGTMSGKTSNYSGSAATTFRIAAPPTPDSTPRPSARAFATEEEVPTGEAQQPQAPALVSPQSGRTAKSVFMRALAPIVERPSPELTSTQPRPAPAMRDRASGGEPAAAAAATAAAAAGGAPPATPAPASAAGPPSQAASPKPSPNVYGRLGDGVPATQHMQGAKSAGGSSVASNSSYLGSSLRSVGSPAGSVRSRQGQSRETSPGRSPARPAVAVA